MTRRGVQCCLALALASTPLKAAPQPLVHVWYRGSPGCPDGNAFVQRLRELGRDARLAAAGDPIDFLVSVSLSPAGSSGRLERQTQAGQLAIRELTASACEQVTEGLALSVDLALDPETRSDARSTQPGAGWNLGAAGTLTSGLSPQLAPGAALFAELSAAGASARLEARAALGAGEGRADVGLNVSLLAARLEGCPLGWSTGLWLWQPCFGFDLGRLWASGSGTKGRSDSGLWASASALASASWRLDPRWELLARAGVALPLLHYEMGGAEQASVFQTPALGVELALGAAWRLP